MCLDGLPWWPRLKILHNYLQRLIPITVGESLERMATPLSLWMPGSAAA